MCHASCVEGLGRGCDVQLVPTNMSLIAEEKTARLIVRGDTCLKFAVYGETRREYGCASNIVLEYTGDVVLTFF